MTTRRTTPGQRNLVHLSVQVPIDLMHWVDAQKEPLGVGSNSEVVRMALEAWRTMFGLPGYMADVLRQQMAQRNLTYFQLLQELLAKEYERVKASDTTKVSQERNTK